MLYPLNNETSVLREKKFRIFILKLLCLLKNFQTPNNCYNIFTISRLDTSEKKRTGKKKNRSGERERERERDASCFSKNFPFEIMYSYLTLPSAQLLEMNLAGMYKCLFRVVMHSCNIPFIWEMCQPWYMPGVLSRSLGAVKDKIQSNSTFKEFMFYRNWR